MLGCGPCVLCWTTPLSAQCPWIEPDRCTVRRGSANDRRRPSVCAGSQSSSLHRWLSIEPRRTDVGSRWIDEGRDPTSDRVTSR